MRILLDTHYLIWALETPEVLTPKLAAMLTDPGTLVHFSAVSIWEIAIKAGLGRLEFLYDPNDVLRFARETGFIEVPVVSDVAAEVAALPQHHKDPFDRLLVAQAMSLPARLLTADTMLARYSDLIWVEEITTQRPAARQP